MSTTINQPSDTPLFTFNTGLFDVSFFGEPKNLMKLVATQSKLPKRSWSLVSYQKVPTSIGEKSWVNIFTWMKGFHEKSLAFVNIAFPTQEV
jgi:hypothetical protein